jgi:hypothetical protein
VTGKNVQVYLGRILQSKTYILLLHEFSKLIMLISFHMFKFFEHLIYNVALIFYFLPCPFLPNVPAFEKRIWEPFNI